MEETYAPAIIIDRSSATPLYEQIAQPIEAARMHIEGVP